MHLFGFQVQEILPGVKLSLARNFVLLHVTNRIAIKILSLRYLKRSRFQKDRLGKRTYSHNELSKIVTS